MPHVCCSGPGCYTFQQRNLHPTIKEFDTMYATIRASLRARTYQFLGKIFTTDDGRSVLSNSLHGGLDKPQLPPLTPPPNTAIAHRDERRPIIVSARFRSGFTLVWNLFRNVPGVTAFYEPLNESQFFDPQKRPDRVDPTHLNVSDYWREYDEMEHLAQWYRLDWIEKQLYMDARHWGPDLVAYCDELIDRAPQQAVLQFNRADFRLGFFRHIYPSGKFVHLFRNPREQWFSSLPKDGSCPRDINVEDCARYGGFYLRMWARDLKYYFPLLEPSKVEHPYELSYMI